jgi:glutamate dehydrogenase/leucine dehydrogenase/methionyl-tRNA synthetase
MTSREARLARNQELRREAAKKVRSWSVPDFVALLDAANIRRAFVIFENGEFRLSHRELAPIRAFFEFSHDFSRHEAVFFGREPGIDTIFTAFVHDTRRGLAQGGLRLWKYESMADILTDGLRLSQGMTRKNALAGLMWGGGKGIIALPPNAPSVVGYQADEFAEERRRLFEAYGRFVASLDGVYYTAEDMGTNTADMNILLGQNRFTTCIAVDRGGSGNPSAHTAWGVFRAMQAAWLHLHSTEDLRGVRVAVQGAGNVGAPLIDYLDRAGAKLIIGEFAAPTRAAMIASYPDADVLDDHETIFDADADIFAPCARGDVLTAQTIPRLKVQLVCGAANNQLGEPRDAERLQEREILYVPDYLCNRMGITNCADEWAGYLEEDVQLAAERIYPDTLRVLRHASALHISTADAADRLADIAAAELHPVIGHRGRRILDHLARAGWSSDSDSRGKRVSRRRSVFVPAADEPRIHRQADRTSAFTSTGPAVAAMPLSTAWRPHIGMLLSPLLMDVEVRSRRGGARRVIGLDHGGANLQHAVRESLPYDADEISRADFILECHDRHSTNDAAIRHQLAQAGIGFDAKSWLDPMSAEGMDVVARLYYRLADGERIRLDEYGGYRCPECATVLADSEVIIDDENIKRCERCQSPVEQQISRQVFLDLSREARELATAIENGTVTFSDQKSKKDVLQQLRGMTPICISRQSWWGNDLPSNRDQVLSPWFSLAAWTLQAAGWPSDAVPPPIETVYVDAAFLARWVVPSQLVSLAVYGRPVFQHVEIHGAVHIVERDNEDKNASEKLDEDRYVYRTTARRMSSRLGNVVEPGTFVQRFGADSLRLWYLLSLRANDRTAVVLTESHSRDARHAIARLNASLSSLLSLGVILPGKVRPVDDALVAKIRELADIAIASYAKRRFDIAARRFVEAIDRIAAYARIVEDQAMSSNVRDTTIHVIRILADAFSPLCPFILTRLQEEITQATASRNDLTHSWVEHLISLAGKMRGVEGHIGTNDPTIRELVAAHISNIAQVIGAGFRWTDTPPRGRAMVSGPFILVEIGEETLPSGDDEVSAWYRELHASRS